MKNNTSELELFYSNLELDQSKKEINNLNLQKLIKLIKNINSKGLSPATSTNYSIELEINESPRLFFITRSGLDKEFCSIYDFIIIDSNVNEFFKHKNMDKPSAESLLHTLIYNKFPSSKCVLHSHSKFSTIMSKIHLKNQFIHFEGYEIQKGIKGVNSHQEILSIPIFENNQDISTLSKQIDVNIKHNNYGFLISGHGLYVWGDSLEEAKKHLETYEFLLEIQFLNKP